MYIKGTVTVDEDRKQLCKSVYLLNSHEGRKQPCNGFGTGTANSNSAQPSSSRVLASSINKPKNQEKYVNDIFFK